MKTYGNNLLVAWLLGSIFWSLANVQTSLGYLPYPMATGSCTITAPTNVLYLLKFQRSTNNSASGSWSTTYLSLGTVLTNNDGTYKNADDIAASYMLTSNSLTVQANGSGFSYAPVLTMQSRYFPSRYGSFSGVLVTNYPAYITNFPSSGPQIASNLVINSYIGGTPYNSFIKGMPYGAITNQFSNATNLFCVVEVYFRPVLIPAYTVSTNVDYLEGYWPIPNWYYVTNLVTNTFTSSLFALPDPANVTNSITLTNWPLHQCATIFGPGSFYQGSDGSGNVVSWAQAPVDIVLPFGGTYDMTTYPVQLAISQGTFTNWQYFYPQPEDMAYVGYAVAGPRKSFNSMWSNTNGFALVYDWTWTNYLSRLGTNYNGFTTFFPAGFNYGENADNVIFPGNIGYNYSYGPLGGSIGFDQDALYSRNDCVTNNGNPFYFVDAAAPIHVYINTNDVYTPPASPALSLVNDPDGVTLDLLAVGGTPGAKAVLEQSTNLLASFSASSTNTFDSSGHCAFNITPVMPSVIIGSQAPGTYSGPTGGTYTTTNTTYFYATTYRFYRIKIP